MSPTFELEVHILGVLLTYANKHEEMPVRLTTEHFTDPRNQAVFSIIDQLTQAGQAVDIFTVAHQLLPLNVTESPLELLSQIATSVASSTHFVEHCLLLHQDWQKRRLQAIAAEMEAGIAQHDVATLASMAQDALYALTESTIVREPTLIADDMDAAQHRIMQASQEQRPFTGLCSGYEQLDKITLGFQNSDLIIIAARPSQGKTALAISLALNMSGGNGSAVAFFSLEMGRDQIANRLLLQRSGLAGEKLRSGVLSQEELAQLGPIYAELRQLPVYLDDTPSLSISELRHKTRKLVRRQHVQVIIIDYLQLLTAPTHKNATRENEVSAISRALKSLAKELHIPIIALAQLNREVDKTHEGREPRLSDLRESGAIEQDADLVMMLHKPRMAVTPLERELIIAKHRNGATGHVLLQFKEGRFV